MSDAQWMSLAIETAARGIAAGQTPFGAVIILDGKPVAAEHNAVWQSTDITAHAEVTAIRRACAALGKIDLSGAVIYSTCEPCPMCFSACHWARIQRIVYGANIADARAGGFNELTISNDQLKSLGGSNIEVVPDVMRQQCAALFKQWAGQPGARSY